MSCTVTSGASVPLEVLWFTDIDCRNREKDRDDKKMKSFRENRKTLLLNYLVVCDDMEICVEMCELIWRKILHQSRVVKSKKNFKL